MKNGNLRDVIEAWYRGWDEPCTTPNGSLYHEDGILFSYGSHFPLGIKIGNKVLINGDRYSNSTAKHQSYTIQEVPDSMRVEVPLSAIERALGRGYTRPSDLEEKLRVIDQEGDTWVDSGRYTEEGEKIYSHVLGACIFEYEDRTFFSGIDETGLGVHQYFLTELTERVETVAEGLDSMKPQVIKDAETAGKEVLRQGEWFFIKSSIQNIENPEKDFYLKRQDGDTGHHFGTYGAEVCGLQLVKGIVKHEERQHKQLKLYEVGTKAKDREWYEAYHNIQVESYTATGNVD